MSRSRIDIVPLQEACKLWRRDRRTLMSWARAGRILYDIIGDESSQRGAWYVETPSGRYNRVHNIIK